MFVARNAFTSSSSAFLRLEEKPVSLQGIMAPFRIPISTPSSILFDLPQRPRLRLPGHMDVRPVPSPEAEDDILHRDLSLGLSRADTFLSARHGQRLFPPLHDDLLGKAEPLLIGTQGGERGVFEQRFEELKGKGGKGGNELGIGGERGLGRGRCFA